jgi:hypothetical protein
MALRLAPSRLSGALRDDAGTIFFVGSGFMGAVYFFGQQKSCVALRDSRRATQTEV